MSDIAFTSGPAAWRGVPDAGAQTATPPDARRILQLALAATWVLDAVLQYQPFMYSKAFSRMLAETAAGNPGFVARPVLWQAGLLEHHLALANTVFATTQLFLGLGIAFRPTTRLALGASVAWAFGVWWFGEGLGGVLSGTASPVNGAPGAVIIYALLAVLLWPADRQPPAAFTAARAIGAPVARALWLILWLSLAWFALTPANRAPQALRDMIAGMQAGEPGWLAGIDRAVASLLAGRGLAISIALAALLAAAGAGIYLPRPAVRVTLAASIALAAVIWVFGEDFGAILTGGGTDPNSGPMLVILALAYWPARAAAGTTSSRPGEGDAAR